MSEVRALAGAFHERWLETHPFAASVYGVPGYRDRMPDDSEAGEASRRAELDYVVAHVPMPEPFPADEIDRASVQ